MMPGKLVGYYESAGDQFTLTTGSAHVVTMPSGEDLFPVGGLAEVTAASSGSSIAVDWVTEMVAGESVTVWDVSAGTGVERTITAALGSTILVDSAVSVAIGDIVYPTRCLLGTMTALGRSADPASLSTLTLTVDSSGVVSFDSIGASISWGSDDLPNWLRFDPGGAFLGSGLRVAERTHDFGFYPSKVTVRDLPQAEIKRSQAVSTSGIVESLYKPTHYFRDVELLYRGGPRERDWVELDAFAAWWESAQRGKRFEWWPDATDRAAYERKEEPTGWSVFTMEPMDYRPQPAFGKYLGAFTASMRLRAWVE